MSIAEAERDVKSAVEAVLVCAQISQKCLPLLGDVEARLWTALLALGRAVLALFLARCAAHPRPKSYVHNGQRYTLDRSNRRSIEVGTRLGKLKFSRPVGLALGAISRAADLPIDRDLGLCSGFSMGTVMAITRLCAMMARQESRGQWRP